MYNTLNARGITPCSITRSGNWVRPLHTPYTALLRMASVRAGRAFLCLCLMSLPLLTGCSQDDTQNTPGTSLRTAAPSKSNEDAEGGGMSRTDEVADPYGEVY